MTPKTKAALMILRALMLGGLFFACWTASMYLPHTNPWWRVATGAMAAVGLVTLIQKYRRHSQQRPS